MTTENVSAQPPQPPIPGNVQQISALQAVSVLTGLVAEHGMLKNQLMEMQAENQALQKVVGERTTRAATAETRLKEAEARIGELEGELARLTGGMPPSEVPGSIRDLIDAHQNGHAPAPVVG